jgi:hypothetical protein
MEFAPELVAAIAVYPRGPQSLRKRQTLLQIIRRCKRPAFIRGEVVRAYLL